MSYLTGFVRALLTAVTVLVVVLPFTLGYLAVSVLGAGVRLLRGRGRRAPLVAVPGE